MQRQTKALFEARAQIVKALAHPTRLFIVDRLARDEQCVCELKDEIGADMSTVSKHLTILKGAGIIRDEKRGTHVYYALKTPRVMEFMSCVEAVMKSTACEQLELANLTTRDAKD